MIIKGHSCYAAIGGDFMDRNFFKGLFLQYFDERSNDRFFRKIRHVNSFPEGELF
jgi:hypothetical protein